MECGWHWIMSWCMHEFPSDNTIFYTSTDMTLIYFGSPYILDHHPPASCTSNMEITVRAEMLVQCYQCRGESRKLEYMCNF